MSDSGWRDLKTGRALPPEKKPRDKPVADQMFIGCLALLLLAGVALFLLLALT